ncbi:hypothetical protein KFS98_003643 [Salmonella enterica]|nr:hypothetical protein [Salmonella enterica]
MAIQLDISEARKLIVPLAEHLKDIMIRDDYNVEPPSQHPVLVSPFSNIFLQNTYTFISESAEYEAFIEVMNGAEYNGLMIYGTSESEYDSASPLSIFSINRDLWSDPDFIDDNLKGKVIFGENSTSIFTYDVATGEYEIRDRIGTDRLDESYQYLSQLLEQEIAKADLRPHLHGELA